MNLILTKLVLYFTFILNSFLTFFNKEQYSQPKIVIIGGGVSGLAAGSKLISLGYNNVEIFEAQSRLGGRINTIQFQNRNIEIGAQWIHGQKGNPIFEIMKSLNEIDPITTFPDLTTHFGLTNGTLLNEAYVGNLMKQLQTLYENLDELIDSQNPNKSISVGYFLDLEYKKLVENYKNQDLNLVRSIFNGFINSFKSDFAIDSFYNLSALCFNEYKEYGGEEFTNLKNGYIKLIDYLSKNISSKLINLNHQVELIDWSSADKINLNVLDRTTNKSKQIEADYVITTSSLGFLKSNHFKLFKPILPQSKIDSIETMGFGTVDKIFLIFDEPVFDDQESIGLQFFWNQDLEFLDSKYNLKGNKFYQRLDPFNLLPKSNNILFAFLVGEDAEFAENLSDSDLLNIINDILQSSFKNLDLPKASKILRSKWKNEALTKGSYSYYKVGATEDTILELAKPINNKLYFAGEATSPNYLSSVHGAYQTGIDTAIEISKFIKNNKN